MEDCEECDGGGHVECDCCFGRGRHCGECADYECAKCDGSGEVECEACGGTGSIEE